MNTTLTAQTLRAHDSLYIATVGLAAHIEDRGYHGLRGLHLMASRGCIDIWEEASGEYLAARIVVRLDDGRIVLTRTGEDWGSSRPALRCLELAIAAMEDAR
jgi:hypothetical protein